MGHSRHKGKHRGGASTKASKGSKQLKQFVQTSTSTFKQSSEEDNESGRGVCGNTDRGYESTLCKYSKLAIADKVRRNAAQGGTKSDIKTASPGPVSGKCAFCGTLTGKFCSSCNKAYYCCREHQEKHWKTHTKECFPAEDIPEEKDSTLELLGPLGCGPYLRATKDLKPKDVIYIDHSLMTGPGCCFGLEYVPLCLGCTDQVEHGQKCSKCNWPLCGPSCEEGTAHAKYECKIFSERNVQEMFDRFQYDLVRILRCCLMADKDIETFEKLFTLYGAGNQRNELECLVEATKTACRFVNKNCGLNYAESFINEICGIVDVQTSVSGKYRTSMQIFTFPTKLLHSCDPNTRFLEVIRPNGENLLKIVACKPIKKGDPITQRLLTGNLTPTYDRQRFLMEHYYFNCTCDLCRDPSERLTFFSALKCLTCQNSSKAFDQRKGYIIPLHPARFEHSAWYCVNCKTEVDDQTILAIVEQHETPFWNIFNKFRTNSDKHVVSTIQTQIAEYEKYFHGSHYLMWRSKQLLLAKLVEYIHNMEQPESWVDFEVLFMQVETLADSVMDVIYKHQNGFSLIRGRTCFDIVRALWNYIQWAVVFGKATSFKTHTDAKHFYSMVDEAIELLEPEVTDVCKALIMELKFMRDNANVINCRLQYWDTFHRDVGISSSDSSPESFC